MQLKHKGTTVEVTLNKPEAQTLRRASGILALMSQLPWNYEGLSREASISLLDLLNAIEGGESPDTPKE